jgi:hypothetical protein
MNIEELLQRLKEAKELQIYVEEDRRRDDGFRVLIFRARLPQFPFGAQQAWYTLVLEPNQVFVDREEINALLRRFWYGSVPFFDEEKKSTVPHAVDIVREGDPPKAAPPIPPKVN